MQTRLTSAETKLKQIGREQTQIQGSPGHRHDLQECQNIL